MRTTSSSRSAQDRLCCRPSEHLCRCAQPDAFSCYFGTETEPGVVSLHRCFAHTPTTVAKPICWRSLPAPLIMRNGGFERFRCDMCLVTGHAFRLELLVKCTTILSRGRWKQHREAHGRRQSVTYTHARVYQPGSGVSTRIAFPSLRLRDQAHRHRP